MSIQKQNRFVENNVETLHFPLLSDIICFIKYL